MKILSSQTQCKHCGANLEYNSSDIEREYSGNDLYDLYLWDTAIRYITCPVCQHKIYFT